jgi:hypothetical protein
MIFMGYKIDGGEMRQVIGMNPPPREIIYEATAYENGKVVESGQSTDKVFMQTQFEGMKRRHPKGYVELREDGKVFQSYGSKTALVVKPHTFLDDISEWFNKLGR